MLTREAEILFAESDKLQPNLDSLRNLARNLALRPHGYLRVGCLPSHGISPIPDAVRQFRVAHPDVSLGIQTRHTTEPITALFTRELDIGMAVEPAGSPGIAGVEVGQTAGLWARQPMGGTESVRFCASGKSARRAERSKMNKVRMIRICLIAWRQSLC